MLRLKRRLQIALLSIMLIPILSDAQGILHLKFHMGLGANGQFFVGGTLENQGTAAITHGYLVISLLNEECYPIGEKLYSFGPLSSKQQHEFRIPITGRLQGYRLTAVQALDDMGFTLPVIDETQAIIKSREVPEREKCAKARG
jgi:hypothetical protein